jgi:uncharacterized protein YbbK (DUF523 family)
LEGVVATQSTEQSLKKVLVSGCLNGPPIRYNGTNVEVLSPIWTQWVAEGRLVPYCAEIAAGFQVPRPPAEFAGDASSVLSGRGVIVEDTGTDVTDRFLRGARFAVAKAKEEGCVIAVLTDGSPSCGSTFIYDGSFSGDTHPGRGVVAQLLEDHGIPVFAETQLDLADQALRRDD